MFLLDSSSFVTENNFVKEKEFVKALAKFLNVDPESSRASVVLFGSFPNTEIKFGDYRTLNDFNRLLDQTRLFGGQSNTLLSVCRFNFVIFKFILRSQKNALQECTPLVISWFMTCQDYLSVTSFRTSIDLKRWKQAVSSWKFLWIVAGILNTLSQFRWSWHRADTSC